MLIMIVPIAKYTHSTNDNILVIPIARPPKATVKKEAHPRRTWVSVTTLNRKKYLALRKG